VHIQRKKIKWVYLCKFLMISSVKIYIDTCICCWLPRSTTLTFVKISYGKARPSRCPANDAFRLKMHWAEVQSCHVSASYFYYAKQNFLLCAICLKMCITLTVKHATHWLPCKWQPDESDKDVLYIIFFSLQASPEIPDCHPRCQGRSFIPT
jgi:hypothetical protein